MGSGMPKGRSRGIVSTVSPYSYAIQSSRPLSVTMTFSLDFSCRGFLPAKAAFIESRFTYFGSSEVE